MIKTFKYQLYNSNKNKNIDYQINIACYIYNHCISLCKRYYRMFNKSISFNKLKSHLAKLKKTKRFSFFKELNSQAIQEIVEKIEKGYKAFFNKTHKRPPSFRGKIKYKSFTLKQTGYKLLEDNKVKIKNKIYKFHKSRDLIGTIKLATIKRDNLGRKYICFVCDTGQSLKPKLSKGKTAGFDFGLKTFLVSSDNKEYKSLEYYKKYLSNLRQAQRALSRKVKGSSNRQRAKLHVARLHRKVANSRRDSHFKLANQLVKDYDILCFEDLNIDGMKRLWGRKVSDLGFSEFLNILEFKCLEHGKTLLKVDRFYPSSKTCYSCKNINKELCLKERSWKCPSCGCLNDRDLNASLNIRDRSLSHMERSKTKTKVLASS